jgi:RHS repeat-associated protein
MQLASSARLPDGLLAAQWLGAEKPHQGVSTQKQAWHPAPSVCNSTTALGLRAGCAGNRVRSFCSGEQYDADLGLYYLRARYYNPATGRFMSRDPEEGKPWDPATLHKYLYASSDPVNRVDPRGRADEEDEDALYLKIGRETPNWIRLGVGVAGCFADLAGLFIAVEENSKNGMIAGSVGAAVACGFLATDLADVTIWGELNGLW